MFQLKYYENIYLGLSSVAVVSIALRIKYAWPNDNRSDRTLKLKIDLTTNGTRMILLSLYDTFRLSCPYLLLSHIKYMDHKLTAYTLN